MLPLIEGHSTSLLAFCACSHNSIRCCFSHPSQASLAQLALNCDEFLVHGVDVEGMQLGIDDELVKLLGIGSPIPVTYAGGARTLVSGVSGGT